MRDEPRTDARSARDRRGASASRGALAIVGVCGEVTAPAPSAETIARTRRAAVGSTTLCSGRPLAPAIGVQVPFAAPLPAVAHSEPGACPEPGERLELAAGERGPEDDGVQLRCGLAERVERGGSSTTPVRTPSTGRATAVLDSADTIWPGLAYGEYARMRPTIPATRGDETDVMQPTPDAPPSTLTGAHSGAAKSTQLPKLEKLARAPA